MYANVFAHNLYISIKTQSGYHLSVNYLFTVHADGKIMDLGDGALLERSRAFTVAER